jgi:hypothetical protein
MFSFKSLVRHHGANGFATCQNHMFARRKYVGMPSNKT